MQAKSEKKVHKGQTVKYINFYIFYRLLSVNILLYIFSFSHTFLSCVREREIQVMGRMRVEEIKYN